MAEFKRSRLKTKEQQEITKKTIFLGVVTLFIFISLLVFGLPLLIKLSIVLGEARVQKAKQTQEKVIPPPQPRLILPFEATNSAQINISGLSEKGISIELLKNDVSFNKAQANENGEFEFDNVDLDKGSNQFTAVAISQDGVSSEPSKSIDIVLDTEPPAITMINPSEDKLSVDYADFDVAGKTDVGASVMVNGRVAMVDDQGKFKIKLQLSAGKNNMEIVASDLAGNQTKKTIEIDYDI
jgi:bacillopeptidase F